jgi:hypothetical protein
MTTASLVLQYPDWQSGKLRLLATTRNPKALRAFRDAVLEEARLAAMSADDEVLQVEYREELHKLERLLDLLIPPNQGVDDEGD